jgi:Arylsulfotransferase (ASST)
MILTAALIVAGLAACTWLVLAWRAGSSRSVAPGPEAAGPEAAGVRGMWRPLRRAQRPSKQQQELEALPYLGGYKKAPAQSGVTQHLPGQARAGLNLVFSGHGPEAALIDMQGRVLHRWRMSYTQARRLAPALRPPLRNRPWSWRRGALLPDGALLAIFDGFGLIKLDRASKLVWAFPKGAHHDLFVGPEGTIHVLTRRARTVPRIHPTKLVLLDYVSVLAPDGKLLRELALLEAFERSDHAALLGRIRRGGAGDIFHTNTIEVLDGRHAARWPAAAAGNLLISVRELDALAVVDPRRRRVVWAATGPWRRQHDPLLLPGGNLLLFDNLGAPAGKARVMELDPRSLKMTWEYRGTPKRPLQSEECGASHRLDNGNTLIVESLAGRALEVTPAGKLVWEYYNPHRAGPRRELIATLFDVVRIDPAYVRAWLH